MGSKRRLKIPRNQVYVRVLSLEKEAWCMSPIEIEQELNLLEEMVDYIYLIQIMSEEDCDEALYEQAFMDHYGLMVRDEVGHFASEQLINDIRK